MPFGDDILNFGQLLEKLQAAEMEQYRDDNTAREAINGAYRDAVREMLWKLAARFDTKR